MSGWFADTRRKHLTILAAVTLVCGLLAAIALRPPSVLESRREIGQVVAPALAGQIPELGLIMVTVSDDTYHLVRNPDGWVMTEKGDYPVSEARILGLAEAVASMRYGEAMTRDERKFDMIGLGDPLSGGTGALLEFGDGRGNVFSKLIVGYRSGRSYVRAPDDLQAWAVEVENMPPLQRAGAWLDLDPADIELGEIVEVTVQPSVGAVYQLVPRAAEGVGFEIAPPFEVLRVLVPFSLSIVGGAASSFAPVDVAPSSSLSGARQSGVHTTRLQDGVMLETTAWRAGNRGWVTLSARIAPVASDAAAQRAAQINQAANGWAYALTETDWEAFTSPLALLAVEQ